MPAKEVRVGGLIQALLLLNQDAIVRVSSDGEGNEIRDLHYVQDGKSVIILFPVG